MARLTAMGTPYFSDTYEDAGREARKHVRSLPADRRATLEREWQTDDGLSSREHARLHLLQLSPADRAELERDWNA